MWRLTTMLWASLALVTMLGAQPIELVGDGRSDYVIVLSSQALPADRHGAQELQTHIKQMSGVELPIVSEDATLPEHAIIVGARGRHLQALGASLDPALGIEGFIIKSVGPRLVIAGPGSRGTMYGCYTLLEKLGVRWFTPTVTRVPKLPSIRIAPVDETQVPAFEYREVFFTEAFDKNWAARNKTNGTHAHLDESVGGRVIYHHFVHTFDELVPQGLFEQHPEYFPLIEGQRSGGYVQRCLTNADVLEMSVRRVKRWIAERPDATIFSVSQNDTGKWCQCDNCARIADQYGGVQSGLYLWFVNQVAEAIEQDHPDKLIDTLAYQFTEAPPTGIAPRKNVRVRLCPISCCEAHPYETCSAPANRAFLRNLAGWGRITSTLYIWHYCTNFANYLMPFPDFDEFPAEARLYQRTGVKGIFFQGAYAPGGGGSDAELRSWVMSKLLWDPRVDSDALVNEWMAGVYGPAEKPMRRWFDLLHEKARDPDKHFFIYSQPTIDYLADDVLAAGDELFDQAEQLAADDSTALHYIAKARLGLRYVKLMRQPTGGQALESFLNDVRKFGITQLREGQPLAAWEQQYLARLNR